MPDAYEDREDRMLQGINTVQTLWRGDTIRRTNGGGETIEVRTYPTPVQRELPIWLTAAGNPETFRRAGHLGHHVLTHLFHQDIHDLEHKIRIYRQARSEAGHRQDDGRVAVTLHTFLGESIDEVRRDAGEAYCDYLRSNLGLLKQLAFSQGKSMEVQSLPRAELDQMLRWLLEKYVGGRSLMGTVETSFQTCRELSRIGVTEVACLLDFGPDTEAVLANLPRLACLNREVAALSVETAGRE
jgi:natural product biosynthesis luciferase-like monooxygenase protein